MLSLLEYENCVDDYLDAKPIDNVWEIEDNIETIKEEKDEITGDSNDDEEIMEINDLQDLWFSKDKTFWIKKPLSRKRMQSKI